jgi:hypothetical protein
VLSICDNFHFILFAIFLLIMLPVLASGISAEGLGEALKSSGSKSRRCAVFAIPTIYWSRLLRDLRLALYLPQPFKQRFLKYYDIVFCDH